MLIEHLGDDQRDRLDEWRRRWERTGLSTEPADRPAAERGIKEAYGRSGLSPPRRIVWCGSPLGLGLARALAVCAGEPIGAPVARVIENSTWGTADVQVGRAVSEEVTSVVRGRIMDRLWPRVRSDIEEEIQHAIRAATAEALAREGGTPRWKSTKHGIAALVEATIEESISGAHDAYWLGFYDYLREVVGLRRETEILQGLTGAARAAGWWLPHEQVCWVSERPRLLERDRWGGLHCETGPAVVYPDGWCIYSLGHVQVPRRLFEGDVTARELLEVGNAEIRRVLVGRFGLDRLIEETDAAPIHTDEYGALYRIDAPDEPIMLVAVRNPPDKTGRQRRYLLPVDPELCPMRETRDGIEFGEPQELTARNAVASTYGMRGGDYKPARRT